MRRTRTIVSIAAIGLTAVAVAAAPAIAANGPGNGTAGSTSTCTGTGTAQGGSSGMGRWGAGSGSGMGAGMGSAAGRGTGITAPSGTLTTAQRAEVAAMAEEEKLAHDLYVALAAKFPELVQFSRIQAAESRHLDAVQRAHDPLRHRRSDHRPGPTGEFTAPFQALYDSLLAGATTPAAALAAGIAVEKADIADLDASLATVTAPDVVQVFTNLRAGSVKHLAAFSR